MTGFSTDELSSSRSWDRTELDLLSTMKILFFSFLLVPTWGLERCVNENTKEIGPPQEDDALFVEKKKKKVSVGVFVESLCPGCKQDFAEQVFPAYELLQDIIDMNIVPYGNAEIDLEAKELECQHGEGECIANSYMQCAKDIYPYTSRYIPFFKCIMEYSDKENVLEDLLYRDCAVYAAVDLAAIKECHNDKDRVWDLQVKASKETPDDHEYVPWLTVNGKHFDQDNLSLVEAICDAYSETVSHSKPYPACPERREAHATMSE